ncbi:MAG: hypothetical protein ABIE03_01790 [Patescibacteria group bacterium]
MVKTIIKQISLIIGLISILAGLYVLYHVFSPEIEYRLDKPDTAKIIRAIEEQEDLSQNRLIIPSIGVDMEIGTDRKYLDNGGWIQRLDESNNPDLIAIHRFGWSTLSPDQKMKQTLYHVDKLNKGDNVYIIWNGEKYKFQIDEITEDKNNPDFNNKTILYTCKFMLSRLRYFVLLDKVEIKK